MIQNGPVRVDIAPAIGRTEAVISFSVTDHNIPLYDLPLSDAIRLCNAIHMQVLMAQMDGRIFFSPNGE